ncbi:AraC family transcriptional regulator [Agromyces sp. NPDC058126]|uniref:helix-turn-helix transcriptional regulator n=1 Tax=Agromyces sp. NPDC058126 TaxID=3346350 RepID=UPI0036D7DD40
MVEAVRAWRPGVPAVREGLHATFDRHEYPAHTHDDWTVMLVDDGAVNYALDRVAHDARPGAIALLPPGVPHDGRTAIGGVEYRKRVLYLATDWLPRWAPDAAAARPTITTRAALSAVHRVHAALRMPGDTDAAEYWVLELGRIVAAGFGGVHSETPDSPLARRLRLMLDDRLSEPFTIAEAAHELGAHPSHLVRAFTRAYGIPPHRYVVGRRVDRARRLLIDGHSPVEAAILAGFHDQAHLTRHFRRTLGVTPGAFRASARSASDTHSPS